MSEHWQNAPSKGSDLSRSISDQLGFRVIFSGLFFFGQCLWCRGHRFRWKVQIGFRGFRDWWQLQLLPEILFKVNVSLDCPGGDEPIHHVGPCLIGPVFKAITLQIHKNLGVAEVHLNQGLEDLSFKLFRDVIRNVLDGLREEVRQRPSKGKRPGPVLAKEKEACQDAVHHLLVLGIDCGPDLLHINRHIVEGKLEAFRENQIVGGPGSVARQGFLGRRHLGLPFRPFWHSQHSSWDSELFNPNGKLLQEFILPEPRPITGPEN